MTIAYYVFQCSVFVVNNYNINRFLMVNCFVIFTDEEGDLISFSSDEELVDALGAKTGDAFRVFLRGNHLTPF